MDLNNKLMKMALQKTIIYFHFSFVCFLLLLGVFPLYSENRFKMFFISFFGEKMNKHFFFLFAKQEKKGNETTIQNSHKYDLFQKF